MIKEEEPMPIYSEPAKSMEGTKTSMKLVF